MKRIKGFSLIIIFLCLMHFNGCKCGGSGGGGTAPSAQTTFSPSGTPTGNTVYLDGTTSSNNTITLNIKVKGGTDVYGGALEITYNPNLIAYSTSQVGTYLGTGAENKAALYNGQQGTLLLGTFRSGHLSGVTGDGLLATVTFKALTAQTNTYIGFNTTNSFLKSSIDTTSNISGTSWLGGVLSYVP
ncbi:MAG: cohesin domain-containing protein [bacterium]|nr:cohesin domain-containing protein [bacterium]